MNTKVLSICDSSITVAANCLLQITNLLLIQTLAYLQFQFTHCFFLAHMSISALRTNSVALYLSLFKVLRDNLVGQLVTALSGQPIIWCLWIRYPFLVQSPPSRDLKANGLLPNYGTLTLAETARKDSFPNGLQDIGTYLESGSVKTL